MNSFKKMFGTKKSDPSKDKEFAVQKLRATEEILKKKAIVLENKIDLEKKNAMKYGTKDKPLALAALKRKKRYEKQLKQVDDALATIDNQICAFDNTVLFVEVLDALKSASSAMKSAQKNMSVDDIHDIIDTLDEQHAVTDEIADALSNTAHFGVDYDDDELLAELQMLQSEQLEGQLLDVGSVSNLPNIPATELPKPSTSTAETDDSQKDLKELLAWAE